MLDRKKKKRHPQLKAEYPLPCHRVSPAENATLSGSEVRQLKTPSLGTALQFASARLRADREAGRWKTASRDPPRSPNRTDCPFGGGHCFGGLLSIGSCVESFHFVPSDKTAVCRPSESPQVVLAAVSSHCDALQDAAPELKARRSGGGDRQFQVIWAQLFSGTSPNFIWWPPH